MARFQNRVVVVTGGASGIGEATVRRFRDEQALVVAVDSNEEALDRLKGNSGSDGPSLMCVPADVSNEQEVDELVSTVVRRFGRVDSLISNAGVWSQVPFLELDLGEWNRILQVNLTGNFLVCQRFSRVMAKQHGGSIVVTASTNSFLAEPATAHYNSSKGALAMLVKSMAVDLADAGIRVNGIAPGTIRTGITRHMLDAPGADDLFAFPPLKRWGEPEECAAVMTFLASDDASYVTGAIFVVDGGQIALNGVVSPES